MSLSPHSVSSGHRSRGARADNAAPTGSGIHRNILVGSRRLRSSCVRREPIRRDFGRHRLPSRGPGIRADGGHRRVRLRHDFRRELQPGGHAWRRAGPTGRVEGAARLLDRAGGRRAGGRAGDLVGLSIGLTLTLIHLISIPISNTSVNPARSTGVAFFNGDGAPAQLWVFWLAPLVGGAIAGIAYSLLFCPGEG